jgi:hypothetical protein
MRCARPAPPRTTRARIRSGSSLSPPVMPAPAPLVVEPASRSAGSGTLLYEQEPPAQAGGFLCTSSAGPARGVLRVLHVVGPGAPQQRWHRSATPCSIESIFHRQSGSNAERFKGVLDDYYPWRLQPQGRRVTGRERRGDRRRLAVNVKEVVHLRQPLGNASTASVGRGSCVGAGGYRTADTAEGRRSAAWSCDTACGTPTPAAASG